MFRSVAYRMGSVLQEVVRPAGCLNVASGVRNMSHGPVESDEEFDKRYIAYFNRPNLDGWDCRKAMNDLAGMDLVPDPLIINAAFRACRRLNDYSLAVRFFETCKDKCGERVKEIYPYLLQECGPTMQELGIDTPEQLGYDKPELGLETVFERE